MRMTKPFLLTVLFPLMLVWVSSTYAFDDVELVDPAAWIEAVQQRLNLSEAQTPEVQDILEASFAQRKTILNSYGIAEGKGAEQIRNMERKQRRELMKALRQEKSSMEQSLAGVLTSEQMQEFLEARKEIKQNLKMRLKEAQDK